eukprot:4204811-Amphidinium_carterae.1
MVYPEALFQLGPHLRVVRHEDFLQCLDCTRLTGKASLQKVKEEEAEEATHWLWSCHGGHTGGAMPSSQGGALGSAAAAADAEVVFGDRHPRGAAPGKPAPPPAVAARETGSHRIE